MKRITAFVALTALVVSLLVAPVVAVAGGDQVHRPDDAGIFYYDGLQAEGDSPFAEFGFGQ